MDARPGYSEAYDIAKDEYNADAVNARIAHLTSEHHEHRKRVDELRLELELIAQNKQDARHTLQALVQKEENTRLVHRRERLKCREVSEKIMLLGDILKVINGDEEAIEEIKKRQKKRE